MACVFLIGFMASGKTTVGRALSNLLHASFTDTDSVVEEREGMPIHEIFQHRGERYFRQLESRVLRELTGACGSGHSVIAGGGGLPCTDENISFMNEGGITVYLETAVGDILARVTNLQERPVFQREGRAGVEKLLRERERYYRQAQIVVKNGNDKPPSAVAEEIASILKQKFGISPR
jgi:shikimate kinase